ncbi:MAG TPA: glycosyltransferase family 39 protein [Pseudonocardiaceae bacterium]|nr:glycosyltransferase family 39 protein [Pseudonocardiaceae bacterium]
MRRGVWLLAGLVTALEVVFAGGYGYHRDELYFIASGQHLAWGYVDQGPLVPALARLLTAIAPDSLFVLRLPSALAAGAVVLLTAAIARELRGEGRAELLAAAGAGASSLVLFVGHLLNTSTIDLLVWTVAAWLALRAVRTRQNRLWALVGVVLGVGLLNNPLPVFLGVALLVGIAVAGPRQLLRSPFPWVGAVIAVLIGLPWLLWQAGHGWPELAVSRSIAAGGSTSSQPWWLVVPFQFLLASPVLAPMLVVGWWRLFRKPTRFLAVAWVVLAVVFMVTGGKPYYLAGLLPVIIASGAVAIQDWPAKPVWAVMAAAAAVNLVISLPILPARWAGPVIALNPDVGETIGWPELAATVADVRHRLPADAPVVTLTANYGEAGALQHYGLTDVYGGENSYADWGPPPTDGTPVIAVGKSVTQYLRDCVPAARIDNAAGVDNQEQGVPVSICAGPRQPWPAEWPHVRHIG